MLWNRKPAPAEPPGAPDPLATLTRRIEEGERALRMLQLEWSDTLERLNRLAGRIAKRAERVREAEEAPELADGPPGYSNGASEAMVEVNKRRTRVFPGGGR